MIRLASDIHTDQRASAQRARLFETRALSVKLAAPLSAEALLSAADGNLEVLDAPTVDRVLRTFESKGDRRRGSGRSTTNSISYPSPPPRGGLC